MLNKINKKNKIIENTIYFSVPECVDKNIFSTKIKQNKLLQTEITRNSKYLLN